MEYPHENKDYNFLKKELELAEYFLTEAENEVSYLKDVVTFLKNKVDTKYQVEEEKYKYRNIQQYLENLNSERISG